MGVRGVVGYAGVSDCGCDVSVGVNVRVRVWV